MPVAVMDVLPVLVTMVVPPVSLIPVMLSRVAVFVRLTLPLVTFVALNAPTVFAPPSVVPPTEVVVSVPVVPKRPPPDSVIAPPDATVIDPDVVVTAALTTVLFPDPVVVRLRLPAPLVVTVAPT